MKIKNSYPLNDGYFMPAEFSEHNGTIMIFPERPGSWPYNANLVMPVFKQIIKAISEDEKVYLIVSENSLERAKSIIGDISNIQFIILPQNDAWARDTAPTFVVNNQKKVCGVNWKFNAWGGEFDGLYSDWHYDDLIPQGLSENLNFNLYDASHFVLEGGSIHSDGEGTILATESCLLSQGRNPQMSREDIENNLIKYLGAKKIVWVPRGIYNDETNEHVDNMCAFIHPGEVVLAWTDDENDPQYKLSKRSYDALLSQTDANGRKFIIHKIPIPKNHVYINEYELNGFEFEDGEDTREIGERLAASYVNFYFTNNSVIFPQFGGDNEESDKIALDIMTNLCKDRKIIPIDTRQIIVGGGNIHCLTQQIPKGEFENA